MTPDTATLELLREKAEDLHKAAPRHGIHRRDFVREGFSRDFIHPEACKVYVWAVYRRLSDEEIAHQLNVWFLGVNYLNDSTWRAHQFGTDCIEIARRSGINFPVWEGRLAA